MSEEKNPVWKPSVLKANEPTMIIFTNPQPAVEGTSQYGDWMLFNVQVTNQKVSKNKEVLEGYSGEAVWFLTKKTAEGKTPKITEKVLRALNKGVLSMMITKTAKESPKGGFYTEYEITDLNGEAV